MNGILSNNVNPTRSFNLTYIILDSIFLVVLLCALIIKKKYITTLWSLFGGILYFVVDYGYFYLLSHSRTIYIDGNLCNDYYTMLVLLWMSLSYGITNFAFIWLCLEHEKSLIYWLSFIIGWWLVAPILAKFGGDRNIVTSRTTGKYHYIMVIILVVGYAFLIIRSLIKKENMKYILWLNLIGFSVQFSWEFALLISGIRPVNEYSFLTLIIDSLIETNLGMPYIYLIYKGISKKRNDNLTKVLA